MWHKSNALTHFNYNLHTAAKTNHPYSFILSSLILWITSLFYFFNQNYLYCLFLQLVIKYSSTMKGVSASQPGFAFPFFQVSDLFFCFGAFNFVLLRFRLPNGKTVTLNQKKKKCVITLKMGSQEKLYCLLWFLSLGPCVWENLPRVRCLQKRLTIFLNHRN